MPQTVLLRSELSPALRVCPRKWVVLGVRVIETGRASLTTSPHSVSAMQVKMAQIGSIGTEATGLIAK